MASIPPVSRVVIGGVDTHKDLHVAAVVDTDDHVLDTQAFSTTRAGYPALLAWMCTYGDVRRIGIEGTGAYGTGLLCHLQQAGIEVLEVNRPDLSAPDGRGLDQLARLVDTGKLRVHLACDCPQDLASQGAIDDVRRSGHRAALQWGGTLSLGRDAAPI